MRCCHKSQVVTCAFMAVLLFVAVHPLRAQAPAARRDQPVVQPPAPVQFPAAYKAPHTADGKPNLNGIWQAFVAADIDLQDHNAQAGPHADLVGAYGSWPGGQGVVEGGEIPYKPEALAKRRRTPKSA